MGKGKSAETPSRRFVQGVVVATAAFRRVRASANDVGGGFACNQQFQGKRSRSEAWCDCLDVFEGVSTIEGKLRMRRNGTRATRSTKNSTENSKRWQSLGVRGTGNGKWWRVGFEKALRAWIFHSVVVRGGAWAGGAFTAGDESEEERVRVRRMARLSAGAWVRNAGRVAQARSPMQ